MKYSSTSFLFAILAATLKVQAQGFLDNGGCAYIQMGTEGSPGYIQAYECNGAGNANVYIDLNLCLANTGGQLTGTANGNFGDSCNNYGYTSTGTFRADCEPSPGAPYVQSNSVDLNSIISYGFVNDYPTLSCYGLSDEAHGGYE